MTPIPLGIMGSARHAAGGGDSLSSVTYRSAQWSRSNALTSTFTSGASLGADDAARHLVVAVTQRSQTAAPTGVTAGGTAMTLLASVGSFHYYAMAYPTGTLPQVVATWPAFVQWERALFTWSTIGAPVAGSSTSTAGANVTTTTGQFAIGARIYTGTPAGNLPTTALGETNGGWSTSGGGTSDAGSWNLSGQNVSVLALTP